MTGVDEGCGDSRTAYGHWDDRAQEWVFDSVPPDANVLVALDEDDAFTRIREQVRTVANRAE